MVAKSARKAKLRESERAHEFWYMRKTATSVPALAIPLLAMFIVALLAIWGCLALWYQLPGGRALKRLGIAVWLAFSFAMLFALWHGRFALGMCGFAVAFGLLLRWWQQLMPSNDRIWADDVAEMTTGTVDANRVTLHNVRNFDWRSDTDYTRRWETRQYDLDRLDSVDMILSYWCGHAIAHVLISFGFNDGKHVVFSVEIRPEKGDGFSKIGGFFKEFELSIIAADERDVVHVRTNVRGEDAYLYRIRIAASTMRSLFLAYVGQANDLVRAPRFYNTVTVNCTTLVYHMVKHIVGYLPFDYRLLCSGYLPGYVYGVGGLDTRYTLKELRAFGRITERAKESDGSGTFSADIRHGVPRVAPSESSVSAKQRHAS
jgi:Domain of unknown function (DUF4105)